MLNLNRMKKDDIIWLAKHKCKHSHSYLEHQKCLENEQPDMSPVRERVGFLDIESTGLNANWDYVISYAILGNNGKLVGRVLTPKEVLKTKEGFFVVKLLSVEPADPAKFQAVKQAIEKRLTSQKQQEFYQTWLDQLKAKAKIKKNEGLL